MDLSPDIAFSILQVIEGGWAVALEAPNAISSADEHVLNELLRDGMRSAVNRDRALAHHARWPQMHILDETASRSGPDVERPDGRPDIPILLTQPFSHEAHAIVECKRVAGDNADLCRLYVVKGMDRFVNGKYAGNHATGFMVGYVVASTHVAAIAGVNGYLARQGRSAEQLERLSPARSRTRQSCHARPSGSPIELLHSFLTGR